MLLLSKRSNPERHKRKLSQLQEAIFSEFKLPVFLFSIKKQFARVYGREAYIDYSGYEQYNRHRCRRIPHSYQHKACIIHHKKEQL